MAYLFSLVYVVNTASFIPRMSNQTTLTQLWVKSEEDEGDDDDSTHSSSKSQSTIPMEYDEHIVYDGVESFEHRVGQSPLTQLSTTSDDTGNDSDHGGTDNEESDIDNADSLLTQP